MDIDGERERERMSGVFDRKILLHLILLICERITNKTNYNNYNNNNKQ